MPVGWGVPWGVLVIFHGTFHPPAGYLGLNHMMVSGFQAQLVGKPEC